MKKIILGVILSVAAVNSFSAGHYQSGTISNLTAITRGVMIMLDTGIPDNCIGTPFGWLLIKQEHTAITSVVLAAWKSGNRTGTVYTTGKDDTGACIVNQFDPIN